MKKLQDISKSLLLERRQSLERFTGRPLLPALPLGCNLMIRYTSLFGKMGIAASW
jgi:hypothetical protein